MPQLEVPLRQIAHARSGDKGSHANIGIIAYWPEAYPVLLKELTPEKVKSYFAALGATQVQRYQLPKLGALNFVLEGALVGGGSRSLRNDAQGKALGQALLEMTIAIPEELAERILINNNTETTHG